MRTLAPIDPSERIHAIDAVRGFALLGIFLVNIQSFGQPFGEFMLPRPGPGETLFDAAAFYFVRGLCEGKFYPLFSMLFGMGIVLQWQRARHAGRPFTGTGMRRVLILTCFGLCHAVLLWYGDVLFLYGLAGMLLVLLAGARIRTLLIISAGFFAFSLLLSTGVFALMHQERPPAPVLPEPAPHFDNPFKAWGEGFEQDKMNEGPSSPLWLQTETQAYREGPYLQLFLFRLVTWLMMLLFSALSFGWHIVAMFFLGAALMKHGIFSPERRPLRRRLLLLGLAVGVPLSVAAAVMPRFGAVGEIIGGPLTMLTGPLVSLAYLCGIALIVEGGAARFLSRALANVGRMALTNYLLQSLVATTVFYYYGLGLFADLSRTERVILVLGVYSLQIALSAVWLRYFAYGPMEWMWRSLTYMRPQRLIAGSHPA